MVSHTTQLQLYVDPFTTGKTAGFLFGVCFGVKSVETVTKNAFKKPYRVHINPNQSLIGTDI